MGFTLYEVLGLFTLKGSGNIQSFFIKKFFALPRNTEIIFYTWRHREYFFNFATKLLFNYKINKSLLHLSSVFVMVAIAILNI
jgi:hypothetical protein